MAAITEEFKEQVAEALQELGYSIENAQEDTIEDVSEIDDDVTLPGIKYQGGVMSSYIHMKIGVLKEYLDNTVTAIQTAWNTWFGEDNTSGVQKEWADLKSDALTQTAAAQTAAANAESKGNTAQTQGNAAETKGNTAQSQGATAQTQGNYAKTEADRAKNLNEHPAYIGNDNYWYLWDYDTQAYLRSNYAKGDDLHYDEMTPEEYQRLIDNIKQDLVFASIETCENIIEELT